MALILAAIYFHSLAQANVIKADKRGVFERLFAGNRAPKANLTEAGLRYRTQSNLYAVLGFITIIVWAVLK